MEVASEFGLKISLVDCSKIKLLEAAITPETKVIQFSVLSVFPVIFCFYHLYLLEDII